MVRGEVRRLGELRGAREVRGARAENALHLADLRRDERRVREVGDAHRHVDPFVDEIHHAIEQEKPNLCFGVDG